MSICPAGSAKWQMCVLGGAGECQSSEVPIHVSLHGGAEDPSAPAKPRSSWSQYSDCRCFNLSTCTQVQSCCWV